MEVDPAALIKDKSTAENFLFRYFGLSPLLKSIPRDVQFKIARQLRDFFTQDCFVMEKPHNLVQFEGGLPGKDNHIGVLSLSPDNRSLFVCTETVCRIADLTLTNQENAPVETVHTIREGMYFRRVSCDPLGKKVLLLSSAGFNFCHLTELFLKNNNVVAQRSLNCPEREEVSAIGYTPRGEIVIVAKNRDVFVLNRKGACIVHCRHSVLHELNKYDAMSGALIFSKEDRVLFQTESHSGGSLAWPYRSWVIDCNYQSGSYTCLLKCENACLSSFSTSSNRSVIALSTSRNRDSQFTVELYGEKGDHRESIVFPGDQVPYLLSPDGHYILCTPPEVRFYEMDSVRQRLWNQQNERFLPYLDHVFIWHIPSKRVIAYINVKVISGQYSKICFSDDGALFAHSYVTDVRFLSKEFDREKQLSGIEHLWKVHHLPTLIGIWKMNQLWKELTPLYEGNILIEHALLILFLKIVRKDGCSFNNRLASIAEQEGISFDSLKAELKRVYQTLDAPLRRYVLSFIA